MRLISGAAFILFAVIIALGGLAASAMPWLGLLVWGGLIVVGFLASRKPKPATFTREDVTRLFGIAHHFQAETGDRAYTNKIIDLAVRIEAQLPVGERTIRSG